MRANDFHIWHLKQERTHTGWCNLRANRVSWVLDVYPQPCAPVSSINWICYRFPTRGVKSVYWFKQEKPLNSISRWQSVDGYRKGWNPSTVIDNHSLRSNILPLDGATVSRYSCHECSANLTTACEPQSDARHHLHRTMIWFSTSVLVVVVVSMHSVYELRVMNSSTAFNRGLAKSSPGVQRYRRTLTFDKLKVIFRDKNGGS